MAGLKILITGANGFLGGCIYKYLKSKNHLIDVLVRNDINQILKKIDFKINNFKNIDCIPVLNKRYDYIIHAAAMPQNEAKKSYEKARLVNTQLTDYLAAYCQIKNIPLIFLSTVQVYGSNLSGNYTEESPTDLSSNYAFTKREAELKLIDRVNKFSLKTKILRLGNIVGRPILNESSGWDLFANKTILDAYNSKKIFIKNNPYLRRCFLSIDVLLNFLDNLFNFSSQNCFEMNHVINLTSGNSKSLIEFADCVKHYNKICIGNNVEIIINENLIEDVPSFTISNQILKDFMPDLKIIKVESKIKEMVCSFY